MRIPLRYTLGLLTVVVLLAVAPQVVCPAQGAAPEEAHIEPMVSETEAQLLREVSELAKTNRPGAVGKLRTNLSQESSAALDFALGMLLSQDGKLPEAEAAYIAATRKLPSFARAWANLGRVRLARDHPRQAATAFCAALKHGRPSAELWKLLGYSYLLSERLLAAESAYRQALVLAPDDRETALGLAKTLLAGERYRDALPLLRELCALRPLESELWLLQANAYLGLGDQNRALEVLECAHRLEVIKADALTTLGDLYYNKGLLDSAIQRYDLALAKGEISAERMLRCAEALFQVGKFDVASRYLSQAQTGGLKEPARGHLLAGRIAQARSDLEGARKAFELALEADPLSGEALIALGELHWRNREHEQARLVLERACRVRGYQVRALILLAQIEVELDHYELAIKHLEAAQKLQSSFHVRRYLEQIQYLSRVVGGP